MEKRSGKGELNDRYGRSVMDYRQDGRSRLMPVYLIHRYDRCGKRESEGPVNCCSLMDRKYSLLYRFYCNACIGFDARVIYSTSNSGKNSKNKAVGEFFSKLYV